MHTPRHQITSSEVVITCSAGSLPPHEGMSTWWGTQYHRPWAPSGGCKHKHYLSSDSTNTKDVVCDAHRVPNRVGTHVRYMQRSLHVNIHMKCAYVGTQVPRHRAVIAYIGGRPLYARSAFVRAFLSILCSVVH